SSSPCATHPSTSSRHAIAAIECDETWIGPYAYRNNSDCVRMRAIVHEGSGSVDALTLREIERPVPGDNDVLIRVRAASVNALDYHMLKMPRLIRRMLSRGQRFHVPGVDLAGLIEAVGSRVTRFKPGD